MFDNRKKYCKTNLPLIKEQMNGVEKFKCLKFVDNKDSSGGEVEL